MDEGTVFSPLFYGISKTKHGKYALMFTRRLLSAIFTALWAMADMVEPCFICT